MEIVEVGQFQLWEYLVSHRQLLLRRPASQTNESNVDLIFGGVEFFALPTTIKDPRIRPATAEDLPTIRATFKGSVEIGRVHIVRAEGVQGFIISGSALREENQLDLFESSLERYSDVRSTAEGFEREVLLALSDLHPDVQPPNRGPQLGMPAQLDAIVQIDGQTIGIDVKWVNPDASQDSVRSRVIEAVERLSPWLDYLDGLLVVVGSHDEAALTTTQEHLTTALGGRTKVKVTGWVKGDQANGLRESVFELAASARQL